MLTYEKILEVFRDYLSEDDTCEVLHTSRGYLVVDWESGKKDSEWVTARLCRTPKKLLEILRSDFEEYQGYRLTQGYKREITAQEETDIERMGAELATRCTEDK